MRRDGHVIEVIHAIGSWNIVLLEAGDVVPADMRLLEAASLKVEKCTYR